MSKRTYCRTCTCNHTPHYEFAKISRCRIATRTAPVLWEPYKAARAARTADFTGSGTASRCSSSASSAGSSGTSDKRNWPITGWVSNWAVCDLLNVDVLACIIFGVEPREERTACLSRYLVPFRARDEVIKNGHSCLALKAMFECVIRPISQVHHIPGQKA